MDLKLMQRVLPYAAIVIVATLSLWSRKSGRCRGKSGRSDNSEGRCMSANDNKFPIFNGKNYEIWSIRMRAYLMSQDLWDLVENGYDKVEAKEMRKKDAEALHIILEAIPEPMVSCFANAMTSKEAWDILNQKYVEDKKENITGECISQLSDNQNIEEIGESSKAGEEVESLSITGRSEFHVFLSFRGEDTRKGFTSHLYDDLRGRGIFTFIDSDELAKGEKIDKLFEYIEKSKIIVVIFSERYAESRWCLKEVTKSVECKKEIIPVFFGVEPSHVRNQEGTFESAFRKHESNENQNQEDVRKWREALKNVGSLSGFQLKHGEEAKLRREIVKFVSTKVSGKTLEVAKHPIGLETRVQDVKNILEDGDKCGHKVRVVGIHGMGGLGKTTIARAVHNDLAKGFDGTTCFLSNIRERSGQPNGLVDLQKQLIGDILKEKDIQLSDVARGANLIKERANLKRALLVLDDVDSVDQLNVLAGGRDWFGSGSVIIITTRDKGILLTHKVKEEEIYKPQELNEAQSLKLFILHAFDGQPQEEYAQLANQVVAATGRLPLTIKVLGSLFSSVKDVQGWKYLLEKVKRVPDNKVQQTLKISYDNLDNFQKKIFLDISYFFIGRDRTYMWKECATYMWKVCGWHPEEAIRVLVSRSLITINEESKEFEMHDQIRDMGREIVAGESSQLPEKHSRLHIDINNLDLLRPGIVGTKDVEAIELIGKQNDPLIVDVGSFAAISRLRILWLSGVTLKGNYEHFPRNVRWLQWSPQDLDSFPSCLHLENIVVLDLSYSSLVQVWDQQKEFRKLKVLDLSNCRSLVVCPDFTSMPHLEILRISNCVKMRKLHQSIGHLKNLIILRLGCCSSLEGVPQEVWQLTSLEELNLVHCSKITALPSPIGNSMSSKQLPLLEKLKFLNLEGCSSLISCPDFTSMPQLERLNLYGCENISELHPSIGCLKSLIQLDLSRCSSLKELPQEVWQLTSMEELNLCGCSKITALPSPIRDSMSSKQLVLENLKFLDLSWCSRLISYPNFTSMPHLERLSLYGCKNISELHPSIGCLKSLIQLDLSRCSSLKELPQEIWQLTSLEGLELNDCSKVTALPSPIGNSMSSKQLPLLEKLKILNLECCSSLISYPDFTSMPQLEWLSLHGCLNISELHPSIGCLKSLIRLDLSSCSSLKELPQEVWQLTSLEELNLYDCSKVTALPSPIGDSMSSKQPVLEKLKFLNLGGCCSLISCLDFTSMPQLESLMLDNCHNISKLHPSIGRIKSLIRLNLSGCNSLKELPQQVWQLISLEELNLEGCSKIRALPPPIVDCVSSKQLVLEKLKSLNLDSCSSLISCPDFRSMPHLEMLKLDHCHNISELHPSIGYLKRLITLDLSKCNSLKELPEEIGQMSSLKQLYLSRHSQISSLPESLEHLKQLNELRISECKLLKSLPPLPHSLIEIDVRACRQLESIEDISNVRGLQQLNLSCCESLVDVPGIEQLKFLESLQLAGCRSLCDSFFERIKVTSLKHLDLSGCSQIAALPESICLLLDLEYLDASGCKRLAILPNWLGKLKSLLNLSLNGTAIERLPDSVISLEKLDILSIDNCNELKFLLQLPPSLRCLDAVFCTKLERLGGVSFSEGLEQLNLTGCRKLVDIPGIEQLTRLRGLMLGGCISLEDSLLERLESIFNKPKNPLLDFSIPGRLIKGGSSDSQSLSFFLPKYELNKSYYMMYLYVDESSMDNIRREVNEWRIGSDEVGVPIDSEQGRSVVRLVFSNNDTQFPFSVFFDDWADIGGITIPTATIWCGELMDGMLAEADVDCMGMMKMRVSIDGCLLLHADFFSLSEARVEEDLYSELVVLGHNIVRVRLCMQTRNNER